MPKLVVIIAVFITKRKCVNPLPHQRQHRMINLPRLAFVRQLTGNRLGQAKMPIHLPQQWNSAVTGDESARKIRLNLAGTDARENQR